MKTKETLYTIMCNNIGQVRIENAQKEIDRLNKQENTNSWRMDNSEFMFVEDETDDDVHNPCELIEGYVWITCEPKVKSTREQAMAWWKQLKSNVQLNYWRNYQKTTFTPSHSPNELTGREIEQIWKKETQRGYGIENSPNQRLDKPNQKQFKQFDESLFKSYIDKLPESESLNMIKIIYENKLPDCKFKSYLDKWFKL